MELAQKLYENGFITYMRTDNPNYSKDFLKKCNKYIEIKYGNEYKRKLKNSKKKNRLPIQEAHECIRPTNIELIEFDNLTNDHKNCIH